MKKNKTAFCQSFLMCRLLQLRIISFLTSGPVFLIYLCFLFAGFFPCLLGNQVNLRISLWFFRFIDICSVSLSGSYFSLRSKGLDSKSPMIVFWTRMGQSYWFCTGKQQNIHVFAYRLLTGHANFLIKKHEYRGIAEKSLREFVKPSKIISSSSWSVQY